LCDGAQMANVWRYLHPVLSASRVQRVSDLHSKCALRPHHVWKYGRHLSATAEIRQGKQEKKKEEEDETTGQKYDVRIHYAGRP